MMIAVLGCRFLLSWMLFEIQEASWKDSLLVVEYNRNMRLVFDNNDSIFSLEFCGIKNFLKST